MCGICGIVGDVPDKKVIVSRMMKKIKHRGPDDDGFFDSKSCSLGNTRLAIIDVDKGKLPVYSENKNLVLVFNGEIYNYLELKTDLIKIGHRFKTNADSEVLLHLFEEYGKDCLGYLNGMFAFAIWNKKSRELFFARDRLGIKPFYYNFKDENFIFASELKAILASELIDRKVNSFVSYIYLMSNGISAPDTIIEDIKALQPGYYGVFKNGRLKLNKYWQLKDKNLNISYEDAVDELDYLLRDSVEKRLQSDVPIGLFLSGGIDSGTIAYYALIKERLKTFSIGFGSEFEKWNEVSQASLLANRFHSEHNEICITKEDFYEDFDEIIEKSDRPSNDVFNSWFISKYASRDVTVSLSGTGGDEILFGYPFIGVIYEDIKKDRESVYKIYADRTKFFKPSDANNLILNKYFNEYDGVFDRYLARKIVGELNEDISKKVIKLIHHQYLHSIFLKDIDSMSMAHSLEVRVPFLDHRLVEFTYNLPLKWLYEINKGNKLILKNLMRNKLPDNIINGEKKGFTFPFDGFLKTKKMEEKVRWYLAKENIEKTGLLYHKMVDFVVKNYYSNNLYNYNQLMLILSLQTWLLKEKIYRN